MVVREDRKEQIIDKAVGIFAEQGYYKATTALVAKAAGVTQPYVFHFFASKEELFKAVVDRATQRVRETFEGIEAPADQLGVTMGKAFSSIMNVHRDEILLLMQSYTIAEPVIREHVSNNFQLIHKAITTKFNEAHIPNPEAAASKFIGTGMLITLSEVLNLPQLKYYK
ncbi:TetR/AcrR family transcriptional regulator [Paenibacillus sp. L3-i20]|uniref:TetR/AcrR family transcriptional regulator n=1 Tax=Paenibacillus sp. L3-i20 TaxID=2905833 RepID=UPI001EDE2850|nr:TetR/AcrR family transcriptional regulator [Paenibacillus sp. L3-i20]GKU77254.1 hypothetical protein L3i20_v216510 [Paenibacillus sp. L3-i20]